MFRTEQAWGGLAVHSCSVIMHEGCCRPCCANTGDGTQGSPTVLPHCAARAALIYADGGLPRSRVRGVVSIGAGLCPRLVPTMTIPSGVMISTLVECLTIRRCRRAVLDLDHEHAEASTHLWPDRNVRRMQVGAGPVAPAFTIHIVCHPSPGC